MEFHENSPPDEGPPSFQKQIRRHPVKQVWQYQAVKKTFAGQSEKSGSATCAVSPYFPEEQA